MANTIKVKRSAVQGNVPTTAQLDLGEIAINTYDGRMFVKKDDGAASIVTLLGDSNVNHFTFDITPTTVPTIEGTLSWDDTFHTLKVQGDVLVSSLQVGQEERTRVYNGTGSTIFDGEAVHIIGGSSGIPSVTKSISSDSTASTACVGVATHDIATGTTGFVTTRGLVHDYDTSTFPEGSVLYLSDTVSGGMQIAKPLPPSYTIPMAVVISSAVNGIIYVDMNRHTSTVSIMDTALASADPTGWINNDGITLSYDSAARTVTLTGDLRYQYYGQILELTSPWTSTAHSATTGVAYFLHSSDGANFTWTTTAWSFKNVMTAYVWYGATDKYCLRELHGVMPWQVHEEFHSIAGTYRTGGGTLSGYILDSVTATNRRPIVAETFVKDEDNRTTLPVLNSSLYTKLTQTGAGTAAFTVETAEIVPLSGNQPYWNEWNGSTWQQTLLTANDYMSVWVVAVPVTSDLVSQKYRYLWVQGQSSGTLISQQASFPSDVNLGSLTTTATEFVFIAKIIIRYTGGDWRIISVDNITGTKASSTASSSGVYLSQVYTDATLSGAGTIASPLSVVTAPTATTLTLADRQTAGTHYPTFAAVATGNQSIYTDAGITYDPSSNTLSTTGITLSGTLTAAVSLGIGTVSPQGAFEVAGIVDTNGAHFTAIGQRVDPIVTITGAGAGPTPALAYVCQGLLVNIAGNAAANTNIFECQTIGATKLVVSERGWVGIGTNAPSSEITIDSSSPYITILNSATLACGLKFYNDVFDKCSILHYGSGVVGQQGDMVFHSNRITAFTFVNNNVSELFRVDYDGTVGIGIASPEAMLHINSTTWRSDTPGTSQLLRLGDNPSGEMFGLRISSSGTQDLNIDRYYSSVWSSAVTISRLNGYVGIGTISPSVAKLHVDGGYVQYKGYNSSQAIYSGAVAASVGGYYSVNSYYANSFLFTPTYTTAGGMHIRNTGNVDFCADDGLTIGGDYIPTTRLSILAATGYVGIGKTPISALDVNGDMRIPSANFVYLKETGIDSYINYWKWEGSISSGMMISNTDPTGEFYIQTNSTTAFTILSDQKVGIGTTTPISLLEVHAPNTITGVLTISGGNSTVAAIGEIHARLDFGQNDGSMTSTNRIGGSIALVSEIINGAYAGLAFYTGQQGRVPDVLAEAVRIDNNGSVGIGTTTPSSVLDVAGDIRVNSLVNIDADSITLATVTPTMITSFPVATYGSGKMIIQAYDTVTGERQVSELLVLHDGVIASATEYGILYSGTALISTFDVDISGGNLRVLATGSTANSTQYKISESLVVI
jgi:hypothetical protein